MKASSWAMVAAVAAGWFVNGLQDEVKPPLRQQGLDAHETHAAVSLLGQFRTSVSGWLWLRTDLYLHNGVQMRPLSEQELHAGKQGVGGHEDGNEHLHDDSKIVTVVPPKELDFRGWFGDLERATQAYKDMRGHTHNDPEQALPLFRLMTWIDPQFIEAWTTGSTVISRNRSARGTKLALDFLQEGLKHNPWSVDILTQIAYTYITREKDLKTAITYLERARSLGLQNKDTLPEQEKDALLQTYRWLTLCYRDTGDRPAMNSTIREGLGIFQDDPVLLELAKKPTDSP